MSSDSTCPDPARSPPAPRSFLFLPDVIRERIYSFLLTADVDPSTPWLTPLPVLWHLHQKLPTMPSEPNRDLAMVSKSVRKKRRRIIRAYEQVEKERAEVIQAVPHSRLAILATCRTILLETFHLYYKNNTFNFSRAHDLVEFNRSIGRVRANEIRSIRLDLPLEDWDNTKARQVLGGWLRLEKLVFVYNESVFGYMSPNYISYPKVISHLQGLRDVTFVDPPSPLAVRYGVQVRLGMGASQRMRMDQLREMMMAKRKHPRPMPPMMDLFSRLRIADRGKKDHAAWTWNEDTAYAPDIEKES
ncbi:MAG: hypothetical protein L6R40_003419 [Gallowayella cf. fulva]|nr:MAG: hypothetical protein L6R40_003419 [Xanthomendoza cf. fulva]